MRTRTPVGALILIAIAASAIGCEQAAPVAPAPPAAAANQPPQITVGSVSPALGIEDVTTFTVRVEARDPDSDPVSLTASGCSLGTSQPVVLDNGAATVSFRKTRGCVSSITLSATDGRGGSAQTTVTVQSTALRGPFRLVVGEGFYERPYFYLMLEQNGAAVSGTVLDDRQHPGVIDAHEPGTIDAAGLFRLRLKIQSEGDLVVVGQVTSGELNLFKDVVVASGTITEGLHAGRAFKLWREAQY